MSATLTDLANGLAANLTAAQIRSTAYLADSFSVPCALVAAKEVEYHQAAGRPAPFLATFDVYLLVARPSDRAGIEALECYMSTSGDTSVIAAIEADGTLGGVASTTVVKSAGPMTGLTIGTSGAVYTMVPFVVEVFAT